jgi:hypothetical protein
MTRETKKITDALAAAIASVGNSSPAEMREAAAFIRSHKFDTPGENAHLRDAFARYLIDIAVRRERALRETYSNI